MPDGIMLEIDATDMQDKITKLQLVFDEKTVDKIMRRVYARAGKTIRKMVKEEIPKEYKVSKTDVGKAIGNARITGGASGASGCIIPVVGPRGIIGNDYKATGGRYGWVNHRRKYNVGAKILVSSKSVLPLKLSSYGGQPPFRNTSRVRKSRLGDIAFTRLGKARLPIMRVEGIAIPQMPLNRSREAIQESVIDTMAKRIEREYLFELGKI